MNRPITAPNLGQDWIGVDVAQHLGAHHGGRFAMLNDADAVALAEATHGVGHGGAACVLTLTIGTGLGTTVHRDGRLVPNLEHGRLPHPTRGGHLEEHLSGRARTQENLSLEAWAERFQEGLSFLEQRIQPDRIILYGGLMEHWDEIRPLLSTQAELFPYVETAGPLGAAMAPTICEMHPPKKTRSHLHGLTVLDGAEVLFALAVGLRADGIYRGVLCVAFDDVCRNGRQLCTFPRERFASIAFQRAF